MINIFDKSKCSGCGACAQRCTKQCISLCSDDQGFLYPEVDKSVCVECNLCEKVCPIINKENTREPFSTFAAINPNNDVRQKSSSGGVFYVLAEYVINNGGVVFGARFNDKWEVVHDYTENIEGIIPFMGSKYVQSYLGDSCIVAEKFLKLGRHVMFTGTPCQIAGLKHFLGKEYDNLLLVDVVCHGVPSPDVWQTYIEDKNIFYISFRDKKTGWKRFSMNINHNIHYHKEDKYMQCFLSNLSLRPSCFGCLFKSGSSGSDLTLGDFWGISEIASQLDDDKGASVVLSYTPQGENVLRQLKLDLTDVNYARTCTYNPAIISSVKRPKDYDIFWHDFYRLGEKAIKKWGKKMSPSPIIKLKQFVYRFVHCF